MARKTNHGTLPIDVPEDKMSPGVVYQGVCKEIRERLEAGLIDRDLDAGAIAAARSVARSVDHAAGNNPRGTVAAGMQLAALHAQLQAWLDRLGPKDNASDPFSTFLEDLNRAPATAPHPEV